MNYPVDRPRNSGLGGNRTANTSGSGARNTDDQNPRATREDEPRIIDVDYSEVRASAFTSQKDKVDIFYMSIWAFILGMLGVITVMWLINLVGFQGFNLILGLAGVLFFAFAAFAPKNLLISSVFGGVFAFLMDRDKTQGIATGPIWLSKVVLVISYGYLFAAFTLATWSFQTSPGSFWVILAGVLLLMMLEQITQKKSDWGRIIMTGYVTLCIVVALLKTLGGPFNDISNQPTTWFGWLGETSSVEGLLTNWWPVLAILGLALLLRVKAVQPFATMGIMMVAGFWVFTSAPKMIGDAFDDFTLIGEAKPNPCAIQNNLVVPENGKLRITLCSQELERKNIMSIKRDGPRQVKLEFAESTLRDYGDQLSGFTAEDFVTLQDTNTGASFYFTAQPNNEMFKKYGLHVVPLDFTIEYATVDVTSE